MYSYHFYDLKVHFWWPNKRFFWLKSSLNTLYDENLYDDIWEALDCDNATRIDMEVNTLENTFGESYNKFFFFY